MAKKVLYIGLDNKVVNSTVILSDDITVDYATVYANGKHFTNYNSFVFLLDATEEEIQNEILRSAKEYSFFNRDTEIAEEVNEDLYSYNVGIQEVIDFNRNLILKKFSDECNACIYRGFYSDSLDAFFTFDEKDQANFNQKLTLKLLIPTDESNVMWKSEDKGILDLTKQQFITLVGEAGLHKEDKISGYWELKEYIIANYNTLEELYPLKDMDMNEVLLYKSIAI